MPKVTTRKTADKETEALTRSPRYHGGYKTRSTTAAAAAKAKATAAAAAAAVASTNALVNKDSPKTSSAQRHERQHQNTSSRSDNQSCKENNNRVHQRQQQSHHGSSRHQRHQHQHEQNYRHYYNTRSNRNMVAGKQHVEETRRPGRSRHIDERCKLSDTCEFIEKDEHGYARLHNGSVLTSRYRVSEKLGIGAFGSVVLCRDRKENRDVAIKVIRSIKRYSQAAEIEIEVLDLLTADDPHRKNNCVTLLDSFTVHGHVCMVFERLGVSIFDYLQDNKFVGFSLDAVYHFAFQLLHATRFLNDRGLIHTDLKPENILLSNTYTTSGRLVDYHITVIDFGSTHFDNRHHTTIVSTRHYRAPEIVLQLGWSYPCDIWSIGCVLFECLTGKVLFQTHDNIEHLALIERIIEPLPKDIVMRCEFRETNNFFQFSYGRYGLIDSVRLRWPPAGNSKVVKEQIDFVSVTEPLLRQLPPGVSFVRKVLYELIAKMFIVHPELRVTVRGALHYKGVFRELLELHNYGKTLFGLPKNNSDQSCVVM